MASDFKRFKFRTRAGGHIPANTGAKRKTRCVECGEVGHWKGDRECKGKHSSGLQDGRRVRFNKNN